MSSQFTSENNLMLIPKIKEDDDKSFDFFRYLKIIVLSLAYLFSFLAQNLFLKKIYYKKSKKIILIFIFAFLIISKIPVIYQCISQIIKNPGQSNNNQIDITYDIIILISTFIMIIVSELLMIVIINLFIGLLPSNEFKFFCFKQSNIIIIIDKISRLIPGIICMIIGYFNNFEVIIIIIIISFELILNCLSFVFCICRGHLLKSHSLTRIIYNN
jgi:hypothetical protein